jgi:hypothetical protein
MNFLLSPRGQLLGLFFLGAAGAWAKSKGAPVLACGHGRSALWVARAQACADLNADQANGAILNDRSIWVQKMGAGPRHARNAFAHSTA